jgi:hypothetical protein
MFGVKNIIKGNFTNFANYGNNRKIHCVVHDTKDGRYYEIAPKIYYPSITTILKNEEKLTEWKAFVGEIEANRVKNTAASKGNQLHDLMERYFKNEEIDLSKEVYSVRSSFRGALDVINRIDDIILQENILYSNELKIAGRTDLVGKYNGVPSIIDFKGSNKEKTKNDIKNYFIQTTAYAVMAKELYNIGIEQIVIIMFVEGKKDPLVFIENPKNYIQALKEEIENFKGKYINGKL